MTIWIPYKASQIERQKKRKRKVQPFPDLCRICGKPLHSGGDLCKSCENYIKQKKNEERKRKK